MGLQLINKETARQMFCCLETDETFIENVIYSYFGESPEQHGILTFDEFLEYLETVLGSNTEWDTGENLVSYAAKM